MDRGGNFIGRLSTPEGQSAALMLVQAGLAKVHDSAYGTPNYKQLIDAEDKCRKERVGVWTNYEEPQVKETDEADEGETNAEGRFEPCLVALKTVRNDSSRRARRERRRTDADRQFQWFSISTCGRHVRDIGIESLRAIFGTRSQSRTTTGRTARCFQSNETRWRTHAEERWTVGSTFHCWQRMVSCSRGESRSKQSYLGVFRRLRKPRIDYRSESTDGSSNRYVDHFRIVEKSSIDVF